MTTIYHIRSDGVNDAVLEWTGGDGIPSGYTRTPPPSHDATQHAVWTGTHWAVMEGQLPPLSDPPRLIPQVISMRQCRLVLLQAGLLSQVQSLIDSTEDQAAKIEWEYANEVYRQAPLVQIITQELSLTPEQVDDLFISGATL
jgi:hypothetical protein